MATKIGELFISIGADTTGLRSSQAAMERFSSMVAQVSKTNTRASAKTVAALIRQERQLKRSLSTATTLNKSLKALGAPGDEIAKTTFAFKSLTTAIGKGEVSYRAYGEAVDTFARKMQHSGAVLRRVRKEQKKGKGGGAKGSEEGVKGETAELLRNLESAAVLAIGPLSGVGSRIRSIGSIAGRSAIGITAFIVGVTGITTALYFLIRGTIKAHRELTKIKAVFFTATGYASLAAHNFKFVADFTRKMGINFKAASSEFAKLQAAANKSNITFKTTRQLFKGIAFAATALQLDVSETAGVFRAFQQMISKGTVQAEELRGQLGDRLPGALSLFAKALKVDTRELNKLLKAGKVLAEDVMPKVAKMLIEVYGGPAAKAAGLLNAELERLSQVSLELREEIDKALNVGKRYTAAIAKLNKVVQNLTHNVRPLIVVIGALSSALAFAALPLALKLLLKLGRFATIAAGGFLGINAVLKKLSTDVKVAAKAVTLLGRAVTALGVVWTFVGALGGGWIGVLLKLGLAITGAIAGYNYFTSEVKKSSDAMNQLNIDTRKFLALTKEVGAAGLGNKARDFKLVNENRIKELEREIKLGIEKAEELQRAYGLIDLNLVEGRAHGPSASKNQRIKEVRALLQILLPLNKELIALRQNIPLLNSAIEESVDHSTPQSDKLLKYYTELTKKAKEAQDVINRVNSYQMSYGDAERLTDILNSMKDLTKDGAIDALNRINKIRPIPNLAEVANKSLREMKQLLADIFLAREKSKASLEKQKISLSTPDTSAEDSAATLTNLLDLVQKVSAETKLYKEHGKELTDELLKVNKLLAKLNAEDLKVFKDRLKDAGYATGNVAMDLIAFLKAGKAVAAGLKEIKIKIKIDKNFVSVYKGISTTANAVEILKKNIESFGRNEGIVESVGALKAAEKLKGMDPIQLQNYLTFLRFLGYEGKNAQEALTSLYNTLNSLKEKEKKIKKSEISKNLLEPLLAYIEATDASIKTIEKSKKALGDVKGFAEAQRLIWALGKIKDIDGGNLEDAITKLRELGYEGKNIIELLVDLKKKSDEAFKAPKDLLSPLLDFIRVTGRAIKTAEESKNALGAGKSLEMTKALIEADKLLDGISDSRDFSVILSELAKVGKFTGTMREQLAAMILLGDKASKATKTKEELMAPQVDALKDANRELDILHKSKDALERRGTRGLKVLKERIKLEDKLLKIKKQLIKAGNTEEDAKALLAPIRGVLENIDRVRPAIENLKSFADTLTGAFENSFGKIADSLVNAFVTGEKAALSFKDIVQDVMSAVLTNILKTMAVQPLADFFSAFGTNFASRLLGRTTTYGGPEVGNDAAGDGISFDGLSVPQIPRPNAQSNNVVKLNSLSSRGTPIRAQARQREPTKIIINNNNAADNVVSIHEQSSPKGDSAIITIERQLAQKVYSGGPLANAIRHTSGGGSAQGRLR